MKKRPEIELYRMEGKKSRGKTIKNELNVLLTRGGRDFIFMLQTHHFKKN